MLGSMMFEGGDIIRERIQRYQIQCDYRPGGLFVAMNHKQLETLEEQKANWERYGNTQLELLDREAIRREVDSDRYVGALLDHSGGHIHPLNLAIGEADAIRLNGGRVYEQSPVTRIQHTSPAVVSTARGQVTARYVIVAATPISAINWSRAGETQHAVRHPGGHYRSAVGRGRPLADPEKLLCGRL